MSWRMQVFRIRIQNAMDFYFSGERMLVRLHSQLVRAVSTATYRTARRESKLRSWAEFRIWSFCCWDLHMKRLSTMIAVEVKKFKLFNNQKFNFDIFTGGPQSKMHLVPYLMFFSLYISLKTRSFDTLAKRTPSRFSKIKRQRRNDSSPLPTSMDPSIKFFSILSTPEMWSKIF